MKAGGGKCYVELDGCTATVVGYCYSAAASKYTPHPKVNSLFIQRKKLRKFLKARVRNVQ